MRFHYNHIIITVLWELAKHRKMLKVDVEDVGGYNLNRKKVNVLVMKFMTVDQLMVLCYCHCHGIFGHLNKEKQC